MRFSPSQVPSIVLDGEFSTDLSGGTITDTVCRYIERLKSNKWQTTVLPMRGAAIENIIGYNYDGNSYLVFNVTWVEDGKTVTNTYMLRLIVPED